MKNENKSWNFFLEDFQPLHDRSVIWPDQLWFCIDWQPKFETLLICAGCRGNDAACNNNNGNLTSLRILSISLYRCAAEQHHPFMWWRWSEDPALWMICEQFDGQLGILLEKDRACRVGHIFMNLFWSWFYTPFGCVSICKNKIQCKFLLFRQYRSNS